MPSQRCLMVGHDVVNSIPRPHEAASLFDKVGQAVIELIDCIVVLLEQISIHWI